MRWFLEHGADPNIHGSKGECPLDVASSSLSLNAVELLLQYGAKIENSNALHAAAGARREDPRFILMMGYLLDRGADINALEYQANLEPFQQKMRRNPTVALGTALHEAACRGHKDRIQFLLDRGADPTILDTHGNRAAIWTYEQNETGVEELMSNYAVKGRS